jgi:hypothetical protein
MPGTLRAIAVADEQAAELIVLCGLDDDLAQQATAASNPIRGTLTQIHPALKRAIVPHLDHPAMAELLVKYPTANALRKAGRSRAAGRPTLGSRDIISNH